MNIISLHITSSMLVYYHRFVKKTVLKREMPVLNLCSRFSEAVVVLYEKFKVTHLYNYVIDLQTNFNLLIGIVRKIGIEV